MAILDNCPTGVCINTIKDKRNIDISRITKCKYTLCVCSTSELCFIFFFYKSIKVYGILFKMV